MDGWTKIVESLPRPWVSVQVYIPSQRPFPAVREGYLLADCNGIPTRWFVPALREEFDINDVVAWKEFEDPGPSDWVEMLNQIEEVE